MNGAHYKRSDFERWTGHEAKMQFDRPLDGRRRLRGRIAGVSEDAVRIDVDGRDDRAAATVVVPLADIAEAHLVLTDALIAVTRPPDHVTSDDVTSNEDSAEQGMIQGT